MIRYERNNYTFSKTVDISINKVYNEKWEAYNIYMDKLLIKNLETIYTFNDKEAVYHNSGYFN